MPADVRRDATIGDLTGITRVSGSPFSIAATHPAGNVILLSTLGVAVPQSTISAKITETERENTLLAAPGLQISVLRTYQSGTETACPSHAPFLPFRSMKPDPSSVIDGLLDSTLTSWLQSMPTGAYATIQHEADAPSKDISPSTFDAMFNHFGTLAKQVAPGVKIGPVMMEYQIRAQGITNYQYCRTIDPSNIDFWGFDVYSTSPVRSVEACCTQYAIPYFDQLDSSLPFAVAELGDQTGNPDRPQWLYDGLTWAPGNNVQLLSWFNEDTDNTYAWTDAEITSLGQLAP